jgi:hypothetical protein
LLTILFVFYLLIWIVVNIFKREFKRDRLIQDMAGEGQKVYFVCDALGRIKIGFSNNVQKRVKALQTANSMPLTLVGTMPGTFATEKALHARFANARIQGEWFQPTDELISFIREVTSADPEQRVSQLQQTNKRGAA